MTFTLRQSEKWDLTDHLPGQQLGPPASNEGTLVDIPYLPPSLEGEAEMALIQQDRGGAGPVCLRGPPGDSETQPRVRVCHWTVSRMAMGS